MYKQAKREVSHAAYSTHLIQRKEDTRASQFRGHIFLLFSPPSWCHTAFQ